MARPRKAGLDYFPLDVTFFDDLKVRKIIRAFGSQSITALVYLYCCIYRDNGYYLDVDDDLFFLVGESVDMDDKDVSSIIGKAVEVGLFDRQLFKMYRILTSRGIQRRYVDVKRKKVEIRQEYNLLGEELNSQKLAETEVSATETGVCVAKTRVNVTKTPINVAESTQRKEKERKEKERKENKSKENEIERVAQEYRRTIGAITGDVFSSISKCVEEFGVEWCLQAMKVGDARGIKSWKYIHGILRNWSATYSREEKPWEVKHERKNREKWDGADVDWSAERAKHS